MVFLSGGAAAQPSLPEPRAIAGLDAASCYGHLDALGVRYARPTAPGVEQPVRLEGPVAGLEIAFVGRRAAHEVMDCRLVLALAGWASRLRAAGVRRLRHLSAYRGGARHRRTGRPSGHAAGLAIDLRYFEGEGMSFDVLDDWQPRTRGADPCVRPEGEAAPSRGIRDAVCEAVQEGLFQVVVTPHHDAAHANHVHVEVVPGVPWTWIH